MYNCAPADILDPKAKDLGRSTAAVAADSFPFSREAASSTYQIRVVLLNWK